MKQSPRDWLLERHAAAGPQLDELRRRALPEPRLNAREFLRELFRPAWPVWATLAAVWCVIAVLRVAQPAGAEPSLPALQYAAAWPTSTAQIDALFEETRAVR